MPQVPMPQALRRRLGPLILAQYTIRADDGGFETTVICPFCWRHCGGQQEHVGRTPVMRRAFCDVCETCNQVIDSDTVPF